MNKGLQGRPIIYESSFKIAVAREYLTSDLGYKALAKKYGLEEHHTTVRHFVRWYQKHYPQGLSAQESVEQKPADLSVDDKDLHQQLQQANLKIAGLEMLIEIARKELGIDIIKKAGTKQSHRWSNTILPQDWKSFAGCASRTRQAFYDHNWLTSDEQLEEALIIERVKAIRERIPGIGGLPLHHILKEELLMHGITTGRDGFYKLLRKHNLLT